MTPLKISHWKVMLSIFPQKDSVQLTLLILPIRHRYEVGKYSVHVFSFFQRRPFLKENIDFPLKDIQKDNQSMTELQANQQQNYP